MMAFQTYGLVFATSGTYTSGSITKRSRVADVSSMQNGHLGPVAHCSEPDGLCWKRRCNNLVSGLTQSWSLIGALLINYW